MDIERLVDTDFSIADEAEITLRPKNLNEYIGQTKVKDNLKVFMHSAKKRGEALDHCLLYGPPGLGKTTLAHIIACEMESDIRITSGPAIERAGDLAAVLTNLAPNSVLFIDEIHRLNHTVEEILYPAMEDYALDMVLGKGPSARTIRLTLPQFTLVGATTKAGSLSSPLRDRFGMVFRLEIYTPQELEIIIKRSANILEIDIDSVSALEIATRSRGTPRVANRLLKRVRDFAQYEDSERITLSITQNALKKLEIDELGLDNTDRNILATMIDKFDGGPVGLDTLSAASGEESITIEDVYEPYLLQLGFIARTPRGRVCLRRAYQHMNMPFPVSNDSIFDLLPDSADD